MATITYSYLKKENKAGRFPTFIRVCHNYTEARVTTKTTIAKKDIGKDGSIRNRMVTDELSVICADWNRRLRDLGNGADVMTAKEIVEYIRAQEKKERARSIVWKLDFVKYAMQDASRLDREGSEGTASLRVTAVKSLKEYTKKDSIDVNEITTSMLNGWVEWLAAKGCKRAQTLYITQMRAVFNRARREYNTDTETRIPRDPFSRMEHVRQNVTAPRAITAEQLRAIAALPDKGGRWDLARDVFMLSFYLLGMNSVDMMNCPPMRGGRLTYERTKTRTRRADRAEISVLIPKEAMPLIEKYRSSIPGRMFNFAERFANRTAFSASLNKGLKEIGKAVGVESLQFYAARHTWATIAVNEVGIDKYTVHQALNHVDGKTAITDIYIKKSWKPLDDANRKVIDFINSLSEETEQGK